MLTLKEHRMKLNLSQARLGKLVGITQQSIQRIESGMSKPSYDVLIRLASALGITVDELIKPDTPETA